MTEHKIPIPSRIYNASGGNVCGTDDVIDDVKGKKQSQINTEVDNAIQNEIERATQAENDRYTKNEVYKKEETYNKNELDNLITTPEVEYVTVVATDQTTAATDVLPTRGSADTIYRVGNWDGSQYDESLYTEYAWNGSAYVLLDVKSQVGEVYDISFNHAGVTYADLAAALGTNGANIPQSLRKGGMSVKFVRTSDNNYIRYNLIANEFTTDVTKWAICDDGVYIDNSEFINAKTDKEGKVLEAIRPNGTKVLFSDLEVIGMINNIDLDSKVDKEEGKGLINSDYSKGIEYIDNDEWLFVVIDKTGHVIFGTKTDGTPYTCKIDNRIIELISSSNDNADYDYSVNPDCGTPSLLGKKHLHKHLGVNINVRDYSQNKIFNNLRTSAMLCGISMFRSMKDEAADAAYICVQNNVPVWLFKSDCPNSVFEKDNNGNFVLNNGNYVETDDFVSYINDVIRIITRFNGITDITLSSGDVVKIFADYFESCNEWYFDTSITTIEVFYTYKKIHSIVKSISPNTKVVIGSQIAGDYTSRLFDYVDVDGTRFVDLFDIYNYHYYSNPVTDSIICGNYIDSKININYNALKTNLDDKEIWVTETGDNFRKVSYEIQAKNLIQRYLLSFSYGADCVSYYALMAYEDSRNTYDADENYFGLIHRAIHNSYATIHKGDNIELGLYGGNPSRVYLSSSFWLGTQEVKPDNLIIIDIANTTVFNDIKQSGIQISGNGFTIDKACVINPYNGDIYNYFNYRESKFNQNDIYKTVDLSNTSLWSGTKNINSIDIDVFKLNNNCFTDLDDFIREGTQVTDSKNHIFILIYVENINNTTFDCTDSTTWDDWKFEPLPAYKSLNLLSQLLDEGSTRPIRNYYLGVNIFNWKNSKGNNVWCMFTDSNSKTIKLEFENQDNGMMIDYQGNIISGITSSIEVTSYPVFFVNTLGKLKISNI